MQVNRCARRAYAQILRRLTAGRCTNDEFVRARAEIRERYGEDDGVDAVDAAAWHLYDDLREHRLHATRALRRAVALWIVFLHSDCAPGATPRASLRSALALAALVEMPLCSLSGLALLAWGATLGAIVAGGIAMCCYASVWALGGVSRHPRAGAAAFSGETPLWPFADAAQFEAALLRPVYLNPSGHAVPTRRGGRLDRSSEVA